MSFKGVKKMLKWKRLPIEHLKLTLLISQKHKFMSSIRCYYIYISLQINILFLYNNYNQPLHH